MTGSAVVLADLRKAKGLTQLEVSRRLGVTKGRVSQIERDFPNINFPVAQAYFAALGAPLKVTGIEGTDVAVDQIKPNPRSSRDHGDRTEIRARNA